VVVVVISSSRFTVGVIRPLLVLLCWLPWDVLPPYFLCVWGGEDEESWGNGKISEIIVDAR